jgi:hypothetical protein
MGEMLTRRQGLFSLLRTKIESYVRIIGQATPISTSLVEKFSPLKFCVSRGNKNFLGLI